MVVFRAPQMADPYETNRLGERAPGGCRTRSSLVELNGIGPSGAVRLLGDIGEVVRFRTSAHFASWNGTAPLEASSGDQKRIAYRGPGIVVSTSSCTSWLSSSCVMTLLAGRTIGAARPRARPRWKPSAPSNATCPMWFTRWSSTPAAPNQRDGSGSTCGSDSDIQRGRPNPDGQLFGQVTARTRHRQA
jgi:Transposase IS116/IS110/IS902 family